MHQTKTKKFLVHQQGTTCAEIGKCDGKPMSYVAALHLYAIKLRTKLLRSPRLLLLGQGRSLSAERWKVQQYVPTDRRMPSSSISRRSRGTSVHTVQHGAVRRQHELFTGPARRREAPPQITSDQGALRHPPAPLPGVITDIRAVIFAVPPPHPTKGVAYTRGGGGGTCLPGFFFYGNQ